MKYNLCIDIGNTMIKIGVFENNKIYKKFAFETKNKGFDEFKYLISSFLSREQIENDSIEGIILSSVVPSVNVTFKKVIDSLFTPKKQIFLPGKVKTSLPMKVDSPSEVGSDLIADMVMAKEIYHDSAVVIDVGTCTKILLLDSQGYFSGAIFMPGLIVGAKSLSDKAEQLPLTSLEVPKKIVARNTSDCLNVGLLYGHADAIIGLILRLEKEIGYKCHHILTGGASVYIKDIIKDDGLIIDDNLCLKGLNTILNLN